MWFGATCLVAETIYGRSGFKKNGRSIGHSKVPRCFPLGGVDPAFINLLSVLWCLFFTIVPQHNDGRFQSPRADCCSPDGVAKGIQARKPNESLDLVGGFK